MQGRDVWAASIDPFGRAQLSEGFRFHQPLRWPGHYYDSETGLQDNRFRTYAPGLGRYLQPDPLGLGGGLNLYAAPASPVSSVDLRGLKADCGPTADSPESEGHPDAQDADARVRVHSKPP